MIWAAQPAKEATPALLDAPPTVMLKPATTMVPALASASVNSTVLNVINRVLSVLEMLNAIRQQESVPLVTKAKLERYAMRHAQLVVPNLAANSQMENASQKRIHLSVRPASTETNLPLVLPQTPNVYAFWGARTVIRNVSR